MTQLQLNHQTSDQIDNFILNPSYSLLLTGPAGIGKVFLAHYIASKILSIDLTTISTAGSLYYPKSEDFTSGMDQIQSIRSFFKTKLNYNQKINRVVIISDVDDLSQEAANSLLKTLEEPPLGSLIILTAKNPLNLIPTIVSRVKTIRVIKPSREDLLNYFINNKYDIADVEKAYLVSDGLPGLMTNLLIDKNHILNRATEFAREFLIASNYQRVILINKIYKDSNLSYYFLRIIQQMSRLNLSKGKLGNDWIKLFKQSYISIERISANSQTRLVLLEFVAQIV